MEGGLVVESLLLISGCRDNCGCVYIYIFGARRILLILWRQQKGSAVQLCILYSSKTYSMEIDVVGCSKFLTDLLLASERRLQRFATGLILWYVLNGKKSIHLQTAVNNLTNILSAWLLRRARSRPTTLARRSRYVLSCTSGTQSSTLCSWRPWQGCLLM